MRRAQQLSRMGGLLILAAVLGAARPGPVATPTADVMRVRVMAAEGRTELVIDVQGGAVTATDFVLREPDRLVLDLTPARLVAPYQLYDGINRGGVRNVRYAQFRPDVVRIVVELDSTRDYEVSQDEGGVRVSFAPGGEFDVWPSSGTHAAARGPAATLPPAIPPAPRAAAPRAAAPSAVQQQPTISVTFDRASIQDVVATFAGFSGRSIILGRDITGEITAEIRNQPWDVAFNGILDGQGLAATELPGGIIRVDSRSVLAARDSTEPVATRRIRIRYARAASLQAAVLSVVTPGRGRVVADTTTNSLIVTELQTRIAQVETFIQSLDVRIPQVAIQARIIFVDRTDLEELGLRYDLGTSSQFFNRLVARPDLATDPTGATPYATGQTVINLGGNAVAAVANASSRLTNGNPALELVYSTVIGNFALSTFLDALQQVSLADVQAEPQVTVVDNREARIFVGERTPIRQVDVASAAGGGAGAGAVPRATTTFQQTGILLTVTPHVVQDTREILMELHAERSQVQASPISEIGAIFVTQEGTTQLLVRDGETAVIGGLTVTEVTVSKSGIPFLVDLPVVGRLFGFRSSREQRRDLLILVTPHIVDDVIDGATHR